MHVQYKGLTRFSVAAFNIYVRRNEALQNRNLSQELADSLESKRTTLLLLNLHLQKCVGEKLTKNLKQHSVLVLGLIPAF